MSLSQSATCTCDLCHTASTVSGIAAPVDWLSLDLSSIENYLPEKHLCPFCQQEIIQSLLKKKSMNHTPLSACPYCGCTPRLSIKADGIHSGDWFAECSNSIDCPVWPVTSPRKTRELAIAAWNTRVSPAERRRRNRAAEKAEREACASLS